MMARSRALGNACNHVLSVVSDIRMRRRNVKCDVGGEDV